MREDLYLPFKPTLEHQDPVDLTEAHRMQLTSSAQASKPSEVPEVLVQAEERPAANRKFCVREPSPEIQV
jgi:hypothetical protein